MFFPEKTKFSYENDIITIDAIGGRITLGRYWLIISAPKKRTIFRRGRPINGPSDVFADYIFHRRHATHRQSAGIDFDRKRTEWSYDIISGERKKNSEFMVFALFTIELWPTNDVFVCFRSYSLFEVRPGITRCSPRVEKKAPRQQ